MHLGEKRYVEEYVLHSEAVLITVKNLYKTKGGEKSHILIDLHYIASMLKGIVVCLCFKLIHEYLLMDEISSAKYYKHEILKKGICVLQSSENEEILSVVIISFNMREINQI